MLSAAAVHTSYPALQLALQPVHQWYVQPGPLVLGSTPLNSSTRIADRDRTVSRRSEPTTYHFNWRTAKPRDRSSPRMMSRHRGAKHCRRYEPAVSPLSPAYFYPLSDGPSTQNHRITMTVSTLLDLSVSQSGKFAFYEHF